MTDYKKMQDIINEIDSLVQHSVVPAAPAFQAWYNLTERFLLKLYGKESIEYENFKNTSFSPRIYSDVRQVISKCKEGLLACKLTFQGYIEELKEESEETQVIAHAEKIEEFLKIFIVHGHDGELKQSVARIIEKQGIEAIILSEQANKGRTIIEKFEDYSDVGGAICLFTADDYGRAKNDATDNTRARQNVVLETGYFMGKLGRDHVVLLADKGIEMPSDLSGVVYTDTGSWQFALLKELAAMGYKVDLNKLL